MARDGVFAFGPYHFDTRAKRLSKGGAAVSLAPRHVDLLHLLITRAGEVVRKRDLIETAWQGVSVTDSSLLKAMMELRKVLDANPDRFLANVPRRGFRFTADLTPVVEHQTADLMELLAGDRALVNGIAALVTLGRGELEGAIALFTQAVARNPKDPAYRAGLANAYLMRHEASLGGATPDFESLAHAATEARAACALDNQHGQALSVLGFVLYRMGDEAGALAALRRATRIEPAIWWHHFRLGWVSWGGERVAAARAALEIAPDQPAPRFLIARVLVACNRLAEAEAELDLGLAAMQGDVPGRTRFAAVGLDWLKGCLLDIRGEGAAALAAWRREIDREASGHLYAREYAAESHHAIGVYHLRRGQDGTARTAFRETLARMPNHEGALTGLELLDADLSPASDEARVSVADSLPGPGRVPLRDAAIRVFARDADGAARIVSAALVQAPAGSVGWSIPIDPLLNVQPNPTVWADVLALLRSRAR